MLKLLKETSSIVGCKHCQERGKNKSAWVLPPLVRLDDTRQAFTFRHYESPGGSVTGEQVGGEGG